MAAALGSPGFRFMPTDDELVMLFLLPYLQWQPLPVEGLVLEDDPTKTPPWMLLERNGRGREDNAYFFSPADGEGRQARSVDGGGTWVTQRTEATGKLIMDDGETVEWQVRLNFHYGEGRSGSTGWVMHEYAVVKPAGLGASYRLSHIAFTGHGQRRKRVPDGYFSHDNCKTTAAALPPLALAICDPLHSGQPPYAHDQHLIPPEQSTQNCFQAAVPYDGEHDPNQERFLPEQSNQDRAHQEQNHLLPDQSNQEHQESDHDQPMQLLLSHIAFIGHGEMRKRVPDGYDEEHTFLQGADRAEPPSAAGESVSDDATWQQRRFLGQEQVQPPARRNGGDVAKL